MARSVTEIAELLSAGDFMAVREDFDARPGHNHTSYEQHLDDVSEDDLVGDDWLYREIKAIAHIAVNDYIDHHRTP